jgi:hypothetical protein
MEARLGHDFSRVRVHTDARAAESARSVNARAYAVGPHIVFGAGRYAPGSAAGRGLLAHELAHVAQEPFCRAAEDGLVVGRPDDPVELRAAAASRSVTERPASDAIESSAHPTRYLRRQSTSGEPDTQGFVKRIVITCEPRQTYRGRAGILVMETIDRPYVVDLTACDIPRGSYTARIRHHPPDKHGNERAELDLGIAHYSLNIGRVAIGRHDPVALLAGQDSVLVEVNESPLSESTTEIQSFEAEKYAGRCIDEENDQDIIEKTTLPSKTLFSDKLRPVKLWSQKIPLGLFGALDVGLTAEGSASATFGGSYGPGTLEHICLVRILTTPQHTMQGDAKFTFPAQFDIVVKLEGDLKLAGDYDAGYLVNVPLGSAEGKVGVTGTASLDMLLEADAGILYNIGTNEFTFTQAARTKSSASLKVAVDAAIALTVLGWKLWSAHWHWDPIDRGIDWDADILVGKDRSLMFESDDASVTSGSGRSGGARQKSSILDIASKATQVAGLVARTLNSEQNDTLGKKKPQTQSRLGGPNDPMPFIWYKPKRRYADAVEIPKARNLKKVTRDQGPTEVEYDVGSGPGVFGGQGVAVDKFGVAKDNWVREDNVFMYEKTDTAGRSRQKGFRDTLGNLGFKWSGWQADHVRDLEFGDLDRNDNLWPLDETVNLAAGPLHYRQLEEHKAQLEHIAGSLSKGDKFNIVIIDVRDPRR